MPDRILVVDDDQLIVLGVIRGLKRLGCEVEAALSCRQALEMIRTNDPFDLVLADWELPGMDGLEFLQRCRDQAPDMTRMMLSGGEQDKTIQEAVQDGLLFRFIPKPCTPHQLGIHLYDALKSSPTTLAVGTSG